MAFRLLVLTVQLAAIVRSDVITGIPDAAPPGFEEWVSPVIVPAPNTSATGLGDASWAVALQKARAFVKQLTLYEKINVTTGTDVETRCVGNTGRLVLHVVYHATLFILLRAGTIPRLGWKGLCLEDSPLGVRFTDFASAL